MPPNLYDAIHKYAKNPIERQHVVQSSKALAKFGIDPARWHLLAADRDAWRETLRCGLAPAAFRRPPTPEPIARTRAVRSSSAATMARIGTSLRLSA